MPNDTRDFIRTANARKLDAAVARIVFLKSGTKVEFKNVTTIDVHIDHHIYRTDSRSIIHITLLC